jgi:hypothetical protein
VKTFQKEVQLEPNSEKGLLLIPFGDVHYGSLDCDKERFHRLLKWCSKKKKAGWKVLLFGMGDYLDFMSGSEQAAVNAAKGGFGFHQSTLETLDTIMMARCEKFVGLLAPLKENILFLLEGNHTYKLVSEVAGAWAGKRTTEYMAGLLGVSSPGIMTLGRISFPPSSLYLEILAHHGRGSARTKGARLMVRKQAAEVAPGANLIFMGHDHEKVAGVDQGLLLDPESEDGIKTFKRYYIGTGSFLKGYRANSSSATYIEEKLFPPSDLGVSIVTVLLEKDSGKYRVDFHVSV